MAYIFRNPHRQELDAIDQEIQRRKQEIAFSQKRLLELEQARKTVLPLAEAETQEITASLPVLCLRVLSFTPTASVSVPQIRDGLATMGIQVYGNNPLGILHTAVGRLVHRGYAIPTTGGFQISRGGKDYLRQVL